MNQITLYGLKRCSTCVKAISWLDQRHIKHVFIDYRDQPVAQESLAMWAQALGGWEKLVNRASTTWRNLPDARKNLDRDQDWLALIAEFPTLIKRPVMVQDDGAVNVGFSDKKYTELLGN